MFTKYTITLSDYDRATVLCALSHYRTINQDFYDSGDLDLESARRCHERITSADTLYHLLCESGEVVSDADN